MGSLTSALVTSSNGSIPASYAATRARSMKPVRGSGLAAATTTTSWSAFATTARSMGSVSSALRRSSVRRSWIFTSRARVSGAPETSPTRDTKSPATTGERRSSRARAAITVRSFPLSSPTTAV
ncbi:hypothetical protein D9M72_499930 [compost metagenome]